MPREGAGGKMAPWLVCREGVEDMGQGPGNNAYGLQEGGIALASQLPSRMPPW